MRNKKLDHDTERAECGRIERKSPRSKTNWKEHLSGMHDSQFQKMLSRYKSKDHQRTEHGKIRKDRTGLLL